MRIRLHAATDRGKVREHNEDAYGLDAGQRLVVVCDGVGGLAKGDLASKLAVEALLRLLRPGSDALLRAALPGQHGISSNGARLVAAARLANLRTYLVAASDKACAGMGTTLVALTASGSGDVIAVNVGDSRAYRFRDGGLKQLTTDHTYVDDLVGAGHVTREQADATGRKNEISRALGTDPAVSVEFVSDSARAGDVYLLCSDGLHGVVSDSRIAELIRESAGDLESLASRLIAEANRAGGPDNITVALLAVDDALERVGSVPSQLDVPDTVEAFPKRRRIIERLYPDPRRRRGRALLFVGSAILVLAVMAAIVWLATRPPGSTRPEFVIEPARLNSQVRLSLDGEDITDGYPPKLVKGREYVFVATAPRYCPDTTVVLTRDSLVVVRFHLIPEADVMVSYPYAEPGFRARVVVEHGGVVDTATVMGSQSVVIPVMCGPVSVAVDGGRVHGTWSGSLDRGDRLLMVPASDYEEVFAGRAGREQ